MVNVESRHAWLIVLPALALSGCRTPEQTEARVQRKEELRAAQEERREEARAKRQGRATIERCSAYIYRADPKDTFQRGIPVFVYVGDERIAGLSIGQSLCLRLATGKQTVSIRDPVLALPGPEVASIDVEVSDASTVYIRHLRFFAGAVPVPGGVAVQSKTTLDVVTEDAWRGRQ